MTSIGLIVRSAPRGARLEAWRRRIRRDAVLRTAPQDEADVRGDHGAWRLGLAARVGAP